MVHGTVTKVAVNGRYGFIRADHWKGRDLFFHASNCVTPFENLAEGQRVACLTEDSPRGERALEVRLLPDQAAAQGQQTEERDAR